MSVQGALLIIACLGAIGVGALAAAAVQEERTKTNLKKNAQVHLSLVDGQARPYFLCTGAHARMLDALCRESQKTSVGALPGHGLHDTVAGRSPQYGNKPKKSFTDLVRKAGLSDKVTKQGFARVRRKSLLGLFLGGFVLGSCLSMESSVLFACTGALAGWRFPVEALRQEAAKRRSELENHLPEMLEVVVLGLGSGLSFERSFELYHQHFDTAFARACSQAHQQWTLGLLSREDALRSLSGQYDSNLFARIVDQVIWSLRFGSALTTSLQAFAAEARAAYKAATEEKVAKAPIKMMVPTSALILPAMLILVLGPILLEMMQGF